MARTLRSDNQKDPKERVPKNVGTGSELFQSERQFDWTGCGDFVPSPIDVARSDKDRADMKPRGWHVAISSFIPI
jgi:hypothetical protein